MGRSYIVDVVVEKYLSSIGASGAVCTTGLLIGQSSPQRDFVVLSTKTPQRGSESSGTLDDVDVDWVTEHAKQVSSMLPGGLSVLGVFLIVPPELSKEATNVLRKLVFAVEKYLSKERLWNDREEDVSDRVALQICSKTRKVICKTFDVKDPKTSAKPAEWKYQSGVSSTWPLVTCSVGINLRLPVSDKSLEDTHRCVREGLQRWAKSISSGTCLINGKFMSPDTELMGGGGQKKNPKQGQVKLQAQLLLPPEQCPPEQTTCAVSQPTASVAIRGQVSCRAYVHSNKPRAGQAAEAIKRDILNTVSSRVDMLYDDLFMNQSEVGSGGPKKAVEKSHSLPLRVFAPVPESAFCVCDYMFPDECVSAVAEHFQEILDRSVAEESIVTGLEVSREDTRTNTPGQHHTAGDRCQEDTEETLPTQLHHSGPPQPQDDVPKKQQGLQYYVGLAVAGGVAMLAAAMSMLYLGEE